MVWWLAPLIISTIASTATTLYASSKASKAQEEASSAQQASTQAALDQEWRMYQQARADLGPGREAQAWALSQLIGGGGTGGGSGGALGGGAVADSPELLEARSNLQGLEREAQAFVDGLPPWAQEGATDIFEGRLQEARNKVAQLEQTQQQQFGAGGGAGGQFGGLLGQGPGEFVPEDQPGYEFGFEEFIRDPYLKMQGAKGKRLSGETLKGLTKYASDYASTQYDNFLNRYYQKLNPYLSIAGMGQVSASGSANIAGQMGTNMANLQLQQGNIQAQNALQQGSIATQTAAGVGGSFQNAMQEYMTFQMMKNMGVD